jgi:hypothetical protein
MVQYVPPPEDLSRLNPIQRYMQKGELEWNDYYWLFGLVFLYIMARPAIQRFFTTTLGRSAAEEEGAKEREAYYQRRAKVGPNAIRGGKDDALNMLSEDADVTASGASPASGGTVSNRKSKGTKSEADKLLDWDDEPSRTANEGDKSDVMQWLNKWDKDT